MPTVSLSRSAYDRAGLPPRLLKNCFYEPAPTNLEDQCSIRPRPRLVRFATPGAGPIRGAYREGGVINGRIVILSDDTLYKVEQAGVPGVGTSTLIDTVEGDERMSAEGAPSYVVLTCGTKVYSTDGVTLSDVAIPGSLDIVALDTLDQRFIFACSGTNQFFWTDVDVLTVGALSYANAESQPDNLITLKVIDDVLWLVGRLSLEPWSPTGDSDLPFERIEGRVFGIGCTARDTCVKMNVDGLDTMCWVGTDRKVYRLDPNPVRISDFAIEEALARSTAEDNYAQHTFWNGHDFYLLHIPGEGTFAYDLTTRIGWTQWTSYGLDEFRTAVSAIGPNAQPLLGDDTLGVLYELTEDEREDDGSPVVFEGSALLEVTGPPVKNINFMLTCQTGSVDNTTDDPMMQLGVSDNHGKTVTWYPNKPLGRQGQWTLKVLWKKLGMLIRERGRLYIWRTTEPIVVLKAKYNEHF